ncbi:MAG: response regulator transcription factor [Chitinophagales bacterium]|nr:response regulator transcription factor [Chitinophagales bacterium]
MNKKILYVEDEINLGRIVSETLETKGFEVLLVKDGAKVMESFKIFTPDVCVLDVMLPHVDGFELGQEIRSRYPALPIIFLTAKTQTKDVVQGFESGGTDYVRKPFSMDELIARINNQLVLATNQSLTRGEEEIKLSRFLFYPQKLELHSSNQIIKLSNREAQVLHLLCEYVNRAIDRKTLLMEVWGDDSFFHSRNLDVYIRKLRSYFSSDAGVQIITLKGQGYQFVVETTGTNH